MRLWIAALLMARAAVGTGSIPRCRWVRPWSAEPAKANAPNISTDITPPISIIDQH